ncbi:hypothetical protein CVT24_002254 [Panaeolus cyanescens]|uniref:Uncharacterized protein n=1 Tax=Panaeolus cyanescens TaxID=181874 RepID=A0A409WUY3_9AGAR|nr:hypothetical protein CVT24_002254 [Panaeolus cyanescens]
MKHKKLEPMQDPFNPQFGSVSVPTYENVRLAACYVWYCNRGERPSDWFVTFVKAGQRKGQEDHSFLLNIGFIDDARDTDQFLDLFYQNVDIDLQALQRIRRYNGIKNGRDAVESKVFKIPFSAEETDPDTPNPPIMTSHSLYSGVNHVYYKVAIDYNDIANAEHVDTSKSLTPHHRPLLFMLSVIATMFFYDYVSDSNASGFTAWLDANGFNASPLYNLMSPPSVDPSS